jgi:hypothetical protein
MVRRCVPDADCATEIRAGAICATGALGGASVCAVVRAIGGAAIAMAGGVAGRAEIAAAAAGGEDKGGT